MEYLQNTGQLLDGYSAQVTSLGIPLALLCFELWLSHTLRQGDDVASQQQFSGRGVTAGLLGISSIHNSVPFIFLEVYWSFLIYCIKIYEKSVIKYIFVYIECISIVYIYVYTYMCVSPPSHGLPCLGRHSCHSLEQASLSSSFGWLLLFL